MGYFFRFFLFLYFGCLVSGLPKLLHAAAVCSLSAGSQREDVEVPVNHPLLTAMASALVSHAV